MSSQSIPFQSNHTQLSGAVIGSKIVVCLEICFALSFDAGPNLLEGLKKESSSVG